MQAYANFLAQESQRQEIDARPDGATHLEITAGSVVRAKQVGERYGTRTKVGTLDRVLLGASPILGASTGVLGSYLTSPLVVACFALSMAAFVFTIVLLLKRRLL
ncbi:hypothetical protein [Pseudonocardia ailaonensis]|uniref:hypothetical protein n=1 Tax=Pseudonocardia ailaonensis TaxID=367279 RepID=UPI0031E08121